MSRSRILEKMESASVTKRKKEKIYKYSFRCPVEEDYTKYIHNFLNS